MADSHDPIDDRTLLESILRRIPGFRGYLEKHNRRQSDQLERTWLAERLQRAKPAIDELAQPFSDAGLVDILWQLDRLSARIDNVVRQIRGHLQDDGGFFDQEKIDAERLERVYKHDVALIDRVEALAEAVESLPEDPDQIGSALPSAFDAVDAIEREMDVRSKMLEYLVD